jgi:hypothetical protein
MFYQDSTTARAAQHRADLVGDAEHARQVRLAARRTGSSRRGTHLPVLRAAVDRLRTAVTATARPVAG